MASLVGKYVRELFMRLLNRHFGYENKVPRVSGYPGDPKTLKLLEQVRARYPDNARAEWIRCK